MSSRKSSQGSHSSRSSKYSENTQLEKTKQESKHLVERVKKAQQEKETELREKEDRLLKYIPEHFPKEARDKMKKMNEINRKHRKKNYTTEIQKILKSQGLVYRALKDSSGSSSGFKPSPNRSVFDIKKVTEKYYTDVKPSRRFPRKKGGSRHTRKNKRNSH